MLATSHWVTGAHQVVGPIQGPVTKASGAPSGEVAQLGRQLFTTYLFAFEATAALLVIAVVGAVVLARRPALSEKDERDALAARDEQDDHDQSERGVSL
jgi:NADH-quinone oxidoreductase subunit J